MVVDTANTIWRNFVTDGVPSSGAHKPEKAKVREWATFIESLIQAAGFGNTVWFATKALLDADLDHVAGTPATVYQDTTSANNGVYLKSGASGAGSWGQILTFLPGYQFVTATDAGAGSANAIVATTSPRVAYVDGVQLIRLNISATNTAAAVTVSFDGGAALSVKTASNNNPAIGGLAAGMTVLGVVDQSGTVFRLLSDQASSAIQAASEAAQGYAEEWANKAEDSLVSVAAGGDGATDFSGRHWAAKSAGSASNALDSENGAGVSAAAADAAATAAGAPIHVDIAAGLAATSDGDIFMVPAGDGTYIVYENDTGSEVEIQRTPYRRFKTTALLLASSDAARGEGAVWEAGSFRYHEAGSGASDHHVTTAGGVKLYVLPGANGFDVQPFGAVGDGTADDRAELHEANLAGGDKNVPSGTYKVDSALTLSGVWRFAVGAKIRPSSGIAVTLDSTFKAISQEDWQDTSTGGSFSSGAGSWEWRGVTRVSAPTGGPSFNFGHPGNEIDESSTATYVYGGTANYPHTVGADSELSTIGGGYDNAIGDTAPAATIAGGAHHIVSDGASHAAILGGAYQTVKQDYGTAVGGSDNVVESQYSFVGGGQGNVAGLAGAGTPLDYRSAFVGAGAGNIASGLRSAIPGGVTNTASGSESNVGGGSTNTASGAQSTVVGGSGNTASGLSSVAGGASANASANYAVALGEFLEATATGSLATGIRSKAYLRGQHAHASGYFAAKGDAQASRLVGRYQTTNAATQSLDLNGGAATKIVLPDNTTWGFVAHVVARRADADGENGFYLVKGCIKRDSGAATTAIVGTVTTETIAEDNAGWNVTAAADTSNGALLIQVTGETSKTVRWVGKVELSEVSG